MTDKKGDDCSCAACSPLGVGTNPENCTAGSSSPKSTERGMRRKGQRTRSARDASSKEPDSPPAEEAWKRAYAFTDPKRPELGVRHAGCTYLAAYRDGIAHCNKCGWTHTYEPKSERSEGASSSDPPPVRGAEETGARAESVTLWRCKQGNGVYRDRPGPWKVAIPPESGPHDETTERVLYIPVAALQVVEAAATDCSLDAAAERDRANAAESQLTEEREAGRGLREALEEIVATTPSWTSAFHIAAAVLRAGGER